MFSVFSKSKKNSENLKRYTNYILKTLWLIQMYLFNNEYKLRIFPINTHEIPTDKFSNYGHKDRAIN